MPYSLWLALLVLLLVPAVSAQQLAFSVRVPSDNVAPEVQYAHQIGSRTANNHPTLLAGFVGYWHEADIPDCRDCSWYSKRYLTTGVRLIQVVALNPIRFSLAKGLNREFLFARQLGTNDAYPAENYRDHVYAIEGSLEIAVAIVGPLNLATRLESKVPITEYTNPESPLLRLGLSYSFQ